MSDADYFSKLDDILNCLQFEILPTSRKEITLKVEDQFNRTLKQLADSEKIPMSLCQRLCSTGAQPARLYGLAKVHKEATPLRPVLSLPGSCYDKINKWIANLFSRVPGANIETSNTDMKKRLTDVQLLDDEDFFSLDVKSLYTNVPVAEAIDIACHVLYNSDSAPEIDRDSYKQLMQLTVTDVNFMCGNESYVQRDGVAMGTAMAVILANVWMKRFEDDIASDELHSINTEQERSATDDKTMCPVCAKKVTWKVYSIRCKKCKFWFHRKCSEISLNTKTNMHGDQ